MKSSVMLKAESSFPLPDIRSIRKSFQINTDPVATHVPYPVKLSYTCAGLCHALIAGIRQGLLSYIGVHDSCMQRYLFHVYVASL